MDLPIEGAAHLRLVHLSDLHLAAETPLLRRLLRDVAAERPELIVVSGDLIDEVPEPEAMARHVRATAGTMAALRRTAPVFAVQGHSDYHGALVAAVADAGAVWLANEGRLVGGPPPGKDSGGLVLLGVSQQVGEDWGLPRHRSPFVPLRRVGDWLYGAETGEETRNHYSHYDPEPAALADAGGPLAWSGYDLRCDLWIERRETGAGLAVHSRYPLGEDRMIRLRRAEPVRGMPGSFALVAHGTAFTAGRVDTGVEPEPGRWYRARLRTEVTPGVVRVRAKVWPADEPEPRAWQAWAEDRSRHRVAAGTVGLWAWGGGTVLYHDLRVTGAGGRTLLAAPLAGHRPPPGWRTGARGTRLAMALARSPRRPPGAAVGVLSHSPDVALEAARRGLDFVLAGHTHGGQVRLPFHGAIITRTRLGAYYDSGRFAFEGPARRGWTWLYVNPGFGTSILPIRFWCPPRWAVATVR